MWVSLITSALVAAAPASTCARLCLAPVVTIGLDKDERAAAEPALTRALSAPRCSDAITVDDLCFDDDACLVARAHDVGSGFVAVRAVRVGSQLRVLWSSVNDGVVRRGEHVEAPLAFFAAGTLDPAIAAGTCTTTTTTTTTTTASTTDPTTNPQPTPSESPPGLFLGVTGGIVTGVSALVLTASAIAIEQPQTAGGVKEAAFYAGWASLAGVVVVGGVVTAIGVVDYAFSSAEPAPR